MFVKWWDVAECKNLMELRVRLTVVIVFDDEMNVMKMNVMKMNVM